MAGQSDSAEGHPFVSRLLVVQTLASLAQWIDVFLIFSVPAFLWKSNPQEIALLASCFALPGLFLGPLIGVVLDRTNPRKMMLVGALARTILTAMIAFVPSFPEFAALVLLKGLANLLYWPSSSIITNQVVSEGERVKYFSSLSVLDQIVKVGTPLLAAAFTLLFSSQLIFLLSALATSICVVLIYVLPVHQYSKPPASRRSTKGLLQDLMTGLQAISSLPPNLVLSITLAIGVSMALAIYDPHLAAFLDSRGFKPDVFSMVVSATGAGAVVGAALVRLVYNKAAPIILVRIGVAAFFVAIASTALMASWLPGLLNRACLVSLWFLNGLGYEVFIIGCNVNMQNLCPPSLLGRIQTSVKSLQLTTIVLAPSLGAWFISAYSRTAPYVVSAALACVLVCISHAYSSNPKQLPQPAP